jgi:hypothetical protein
MDLHQMTAGLLRCLPVLMPACVAVAGPATAAPDDKRVALIIGNDAYLGFRLARTLP